MSSLSLIVTPAGAQPTPLETIRESIVTDVSASSPGYTADLPGSLIEDILSTQIASIALMDQARIEAINSLSMTTAQPYILAQLGQLFGLPINTPNNGTVDVVFSGSVGQVIPAGFVVGDTLGNQYALAQSTVIGTAGTSAPTTAIETTNAYNTIDAGTVTTIVSTLPSGVTLTVTNPLPGTPATTAETVHDYRARIMQAFQAVVVGAPQTIRSALQAVSGVMDNAVDVVGSGSGWRIVVGGGDDYAIANAILSSIGDIQHLQGSVLAIDAMSAAASMVITTNYPSNLGVGTVLTISGATPSAYNVSATVTAVSGTAITTNVDSSAFGTYVSGATFNPNPRNVTVTLQDAPDSYDITFVRAVTHSVSMTVTWQTLLTAFSQQAEVNALAQTALASYIGALDVGVGISEIAMSNIMEQAIASVLPVSEISSITYAITIDGVSVSPSAGTSIINYDPEGLFNATSVTVAQAT